jgi:2-oxoglutarate dehydrogenase E1 component
VVRVEELYPFPSEQLRAVIQGYPHARELTWLQEEPRNMGAWSFVEGRLREIAGNDLPLRYVGRLEMASPAEGWSDAHTAEQRRIVNTILEGVVSHAG